MIDPNLVLEDSQVELLPEEKVSLLSDLVSLALSDLVDSQGDIQLDSIKGLAVEFADDGSLTLSVVPVEGDPMVQVVDAMEIEALLSDFAYDKSVESEDPVE